MHEIRLKRLRKELNLSKDELIELFKSHDKIQKAKLEAKENLNKKVF